jgi:hypothetical protein
MSNTTKMEVLIQMLTLVIKIGKYLPLIVLSFAMLYLMFAVLDFFYWNHLAWGIFNSILGFGGFNFFVQLLRRRKVHRYDYRYDGRHSRRGAQDEDEKLAQKSKTTATA